MIGFPPPIVQPVFQPVSGTGLHRPPPPDNDDGGTSFPGLAAKKPIADVLIGALALRHDGLVTRNPADFRRHYPSLRIVEPD